MTQRILFATAVTAALLAACDQTPSTDARQAATPPTTVAPQTASSTTAPASAPAPAAPVDPAVAQRVAQINDAAFAGGAAGEAIAAAGKTGSGKALPPPQPRLVKAQVLLARADFSPGEIDGQGGSNLRHAVAAFAKANDLQSDGELTDAVWSKLTEAGGAPTAGTYVLTEADAAGPWSPDTKDDLAAAKGLDRLGYVTPIEALAEKFHMSEELLTALNPGIDFAKAGQTVVVAQVGELQLAAVDHIEVDKANAAVRAYDKDGKIVAVLPATVGSKDKPSPSGTYKVQGVSRNPDYVYDPKKLTWGPKSEGRFVVKAGPNNPVGAVWIDLNAPSYGLHGTPEPKMIGKTASHGCVRMTNWDALLLAGAVKSGVKVEFVKSRA